MSYDDNRLMLEKMAQHTSQIEANWTDSLGKKVVRIMKSLHDQNQKDCEKTELILQNRDEIQKYCEEIIGPEDEAVMKLVKKL